ncbi:hypothetical protein F4824DRAFT_495760 [Ustulina deusta]|nr:hypothetical protein F4824DRAFT_495760 [Ustulina deusta]
MPSAVGDASLAKPAGHSSCDVLVSDDVSEDDPVLPKGIQEAEIATIEQASGDEVQVTSSKAGHGLMASMPQKTVSWTVQSPRMEEVIQCSISHTQVYLNLCSNTTKPL